MVCDRSVDLIGAEALLEPVLARQRFHVSELSALKNARIGLFVAQNNLAAAHEWLEMWIKTVPDAPMMSAWQRRLEQRRTQPRLWLAGRRR